MEGSSTANKNLPATMQARLAAYQQALKVKHKMQRQQAMGADVEGLKSDLQELYTAPRSPAGRTREVGQLPKSPHGSSITSSPSTRRSVNDMAPKSPVRKPDRVQVERVAITNLHEMFAVVEGGDNDREAEDEERSRRRRATVTRNAAFHENRTRYVSNLERLAPEPLDPNHKGDDKKRVIATQAVKKEAYGSLRSAWDTYEVAARDRPIAPTKEEKKMRERLAKVEDRIDMAWVSFAEEVVKRAVQDKEMDKKEVQVWHEDAQKMKKESKDRRKMKLKREKKEEKEYWKAEVLRLRAEKDKEDEELGSDEEWVYELSDEEGGKGDKDDTVSDVSDLSDNDG